MQLQMQVADCVLLGVHTLFLDLQAMGQCFSLIREELQSINMLPLISILIYGVH